MISHKIAKNSEPFSEGGVYLRVFGGLCCPEKKEAFENVLLSRRTVTRRIEDIAGNLEIHMQSKADSFELFSLALDESCDVRDTDQLLIFVCGIMKDFEITEELAAMRSMKGKTTGSDLFTDVKACFDELGLKWGKLTCVTIDGCPNLTGKNVGLARMQDELRTEIGIFALYYTSECVV